MDIVDKGICEDEKTENGRGITLACKFNQNLISTERIVEDTHIAKRSNTADSGFQGRLEVKVDDFIDLVARKQKRLQSEVHRSSRKLKDNRTSVGRNNSEPGSDKLCQLPTQETVPCEDNIDLLSSIQASRRDMQLNCEVGDASDAAKVEINEFKSDVRSLPANLSLAKAKSAEPSFHSLSDETANFIEDSDEEPEHLFESLQSIHKNARSRASTLPLSDDYTEGTSILQNIDCEKGDSSYAVNGEEGEEEEEEVEEGEEGEGEGAEHTNPPNYRKRYSDFTFTGANIAPLKQGSEKDVNHASEKPVTNRERKRKNTLAELCSKTNKAHLRPRVGLSKKIRVEPLHDYLAKK